MDKNTLKLSSIIACIMMLLVGFGVGLNVGSQLFTERPDFISVILLVIVMLGCIIIPFVLKKEKSKSIKKNT